MLDSLPNARDMWSLLAETPAVQLNRFDVGGSTAGTQTTYVAYGNGGQNRPLIEGINTTEGTSAAGFYFDYGSFDEVIIGTAGNSAEMPSGGVLTNFIGKSGGNQLRGEVYYEYEHPDIQGKNVTRGSARARLRQHPAQRASSSSASTARTPTRSSPTRTSTPAWAGPIIKDKLWFWAGYLRQENVVYQPAAGAILDGTEFLTKLENYTGKLTYQITPKDKLIAYLQYGIKFQPFRTDAGFIAGPQHLTAASTLNQESPSWVGKIEYNRTFGDRGFLEVRAGEFGYNFGLVGNDQTDAAPRGPARRSLVTGGGRDWQLDRRRKQLHGAYTFFVDNVLGGNHQLKIGGEVQHETGRTRWRQYYADNVLHVLNNGAAVLRAAGHPRRLVERPAQLRAVRERQLHARQADAEPRPALRPLPRVPARAGAAGQPVLAAGRHLRGGRQREVVQPRRASPGPDLRPPGQRQDGAEGQLRPLLSSTRAWASRTRSNPNTATQYTEYAWTDRNGDRLWQAGEEGALQRSSAASPASSIDPNLRNSYTDELSAWLERELRRHRCARGLRLEDGPRRLPPGQRQPAPLRVERARHGADPGPDGRAGTGDDRTPAFGLNLSAAALPRHQPGLQPRGLRGRLQDDRDGAPPSASAASGAWSARSRSPGPSEFGAELLRQRPPTATRAPPKPVRQASQHHGFPITPNDDTAQRVHAWTASSSTAPTSRAGASG